MYHILSLSSAYFCVVQFSSPCCNYIEPTTLEGDLQYIDFFDKLMESARYRETKDGVLAKAIVIANKFFQKMLFFQIRIAVDEYLQLMHHLEKMAQRHKLYYYIVHEELIEKKERKAIFKHIQEGRVRLFYDLTEFAALELEDCEYTVQDTVLVSRVLLTSVKICFDIIIHIMELIILHSFFRSNVLKNLLVVR